MAFPSDFVEFQKLFVVGVHGWNFVCQEVGEYKRVSAADVVFRCNVECDLAYCAGLVEKLDVWVFEQH